MRNWIKWSFTVVAWLFALAWVFAIVWGWTVPDTTASVGLALFIIVAFFWITDQQDKKSIVADQNLILSDENHDLHMQLGTIIQEMDKLPKDLWNDPGMAELKDAIYGPREEEPI